MHGIYINPISSFSGSVGTFNFLCRFMCSKSYIVEVSSTEQKLAFLIGTFYWCNDTQCYAIGDEQPGNFISTDCTDKPLTNSTIYQAQKLKLIKLHFTSEKKKLLESRITFDGEAAKRLMDK